MTDLPLLPYAGTSGHSGSSTSRQRAITEDRSGTTAARQRSVLTILERCGSRGATWKEIAEELHLHHGQASGVLSTLHKEERIHRLTETRQRCKVYVDVGYVMGRETEPHKANSPQEPGHITLVVPQDLVEWIAGTGNHEEIHFGMTTATLLRSIARGALASQSH